MVTYVKGNIFDSPAQVLLNPVNTEGLVESGLMTEFQTRFPEMIKSYQSACTGKQLTVGKVMLCKSSSKWVLMFPVKEDTKKPSKLEYIDKGLRKFQDCYKSMRIGSIAMPLLGCDGDGLKPREVRPLMERLLNDLPINIYIYDNEQ